MNDDPDTQSTLSTTLSADGERRRVQILTDAVGLGRRLRRRRTVRKVAAMVAFPAIAIALVVTVFSERSTNTPFAKALTGPTAQPQPIHASPPAIGPDLVAAASAPKSVIEIVSPQPSVTARYLAEAPATSFVERVSDDELLKTIDDAGMSGGLATIGTNTVLFVDGNAIR